WTRPHRARLVALALLVVAFLTGALAGGAAERVRRGHVEVRLRLRAGVPPVFDKLGLTPAQRRRVEEILERGRPRTEAVMAELLPRVRAVTDSVDAEIRAVLTPEQRQALDERRQEQPTFILKRQRLGPGGTGAAKAETLYRR
ncbi:MAG: hypothetical protein WKG32_23825, partial [Gemmatimonadaceae bacterium]